MRQFSRYFDQCPCLAAARRPGNAVVVVRTSELFVQHLRCIGVLEGAGLPVEYDKGVRKAVFLCKLLLTEQALEATELAAAIETRAELVSITEERDRSVLSLIHI